MVTESKKEKDNHWKLWFNMIENQENQDLELVPWYW
jgi:hypothetical protein